MSTIYRAKLFRSGGSQAVRLPRQCRLPGTEVLVHKEGERLIIESGERPWSAEFVEQVRGAPDAIWPARGQGAKAEEREPID